VGGDLKVKAFEEEVEIVEALFLMLEKQIVGDHRLSDCFVCGVFNERIDIGEL
jgi:hypothetical protein